MSEFVIWDPFEGKSRRLVAGTNITFTILDHSVLVNSSIGSGGSKVVRKTSSAQVVNNSVALVDDDALVFTIAAGEVYAVDYVLYVSTNVAAGFKVAITVPSGATLKVGAEMFTASAIGTIAFTSTGGLGIGVTALITKVDMQLMVVNGGTPGNIQLQWAQNAINASNTAVTINSFLRAVLQ